MAKESISQSLRKSYNLKLSRLILDVILESTIGQLKQEQAQLWAYIEETIKSADKSIEIPDGRVYKSDKPGDVIWQIHVSYETGHFINVEQGKRCYDWAGSAYYDIELKGQHPNT